MDEQLIVIGSEIEGEMARRIDTPRLKKRIINREIYDYIHKFPQLRDIPVFYNKGLPEGHLGLAMDMPKEIWINPQSSITEQKETIAHEAKHIQQFKRKQRNFGPLEHRERRKFLREQELEAYAGEKISKKLVKKIKFPLSQKKIVVPAPQPINRISLLRIWGSARRPPKLIRF